MGEPADEVPLRRCAFVGCGLRPVTEFWSGARADGLASYCKSCSKLARRAWRKNRGLPPEQPRRRRREAPPGMSECLGVGCGFKPLADFWIMRTGQPYRLCRACANKRQRAYYSAPPQRRRPPARSGQAFCMNGAGHWALTTAFYTNRARGDGLCLYCIPCDAERQRGRRAAAGIRFNPEVARKGTQCECGRVKAPEDEACPRCSFLEPGGALGALVAALRLFGGRATTDVLAEELGRAKRVVLKLCARGAKDGRLIRRVTLEDGDGYHVSERAEWVLAETNRIEKSDRAG